MRTAILACRISKIKPRKNNANFFSLTPKNIISDNLGPGTVYSCVPETLADEMHRLRGSRRNRWQGRNVSQNVDMSVRRNLGSFPEQYSPLRVFFTSVFLSFRENPFISPNQFHFQLTTSRIGKYPRLTSSVLKVITTHTCASYTVPEPVGHYGAITVR